MNFKKHTAGKGGWSEWVQPKMEGTYLFKCCDCGLVHELEFATFVKRGKSGVKLPTEIRAMFRARRMKISKILKDLIIK
jgi:Zn-finger protein